MNFQAVLFDLDGTLLDTLADLSDSMNAVLREMGFPAHPTGAYRYFVGDGVVMLARRALPENARDEATVDRAVAAVREQYAKRWDNKTRPYDGVPEMLDELARRGMQLAVLSNKPQDFTQLTVGRMLGLERFERVWGVSERVAPKPDPRGAMDLSLAMGIDPARFAYVGDTGTDMRTACGAGMYAVGALWGFRTADELRQNGAKVLLETPADVLTALE